MNHYRILWHSKIDRRRGFEIVDASDEKAAVADWSSRNVQDKEIDRVQEVQENGDLK